MKSLFIFSAVCVDGLTALIGGLLPERVLNKHFQAILAFAAGAITGAAVLDLIPEALKRATSLPLAFVLIGVGFALFMAADLVFGSHAKVAGPLVLIGDTFHNIADGMAISAAFFINQKVGLATTLAVIVHELPHEMGAFAVLLHSGFSRRRALIALFFVQIMAGAGAAGVYFASEAILGIVPMILAFSAGGFLYIAVWELIPEVFRGRSRRDFVAAALIWLMGLAIIGLLQLF